MRRDWSIIRDLLLFAAGEIAMFGCEPDKSQYHLDLLKQSGHMRPTEWALTFQGHDLLDAIRDDVVWEVCQKAIALNGGGLSTDVLLCVAEAARKGIGAANTKWETVAVPYMSGPGFGAKLDWMDMGR